MPSEPENRDREQSRRILTLGIRGHDAPACAVARSQELSAPLATHPSRRRMERTLIKHRLALALACLIVISPGVAAASASSNDLSRTVTVAAISSVDYRAAVIARKTSGEPPTARHSRDRDAIRRFLDTSRRARTSRRPLSGTPCALTASASSRSRPRKAQLTDQSCSCGCSSARPSAAAVPSHFHSRPDEDRARRAQRALDRRTTWMKEEMQWQSPPFR